jgi:hypothetical protein
MRSTAEKSIPKPASLVHEKTATTEITTLQRLEHNFVVNFPQKVDSLKKDGNAVFEDEAPVFSKAATHDASLPLTLKSNGLDLKALHLERIQRQAKFAPPLAKVDKDVEWTSCRASDVHQKQLISKKLGSTKNGQKLSGSNSKSGKSKPTGDNGDGHEHAEELDDMAFLDSVIASGKLATKEARKNEPGWKRWVTAEGVLEQSTTVGDVRENKLKQVLHTKLAAKQNERTVKKSDAKS